ncbi:ribosome small subunit-dependent GTPase A [Caldichromatium japonicum]|uniref:Small ribosomal subunit biogenesis GTPase RsgA n=1 Tax=Caldichromatium japonicum TaxID=2699430 RepID=A0A6G7VE24_9GAMM|nr:ribosome small subunit-dependent GTPase A [Caldichromatium japonicum]QIK38116.1 ribosome small subunit-dependent GTPase A [Caldichromatium japonicum]
MTRRRLSQRQIERIKAIQERRRAHLAARCEQALAECEAETLPEEGVVLVQHGLNLLVEDAQGRLARCLARQNLGEIVCGDRVIWQRLPDGQGVVIALLPRTTVFNRLDAEGRERPLVANLSRLLILIAPEPEPSVLLIDQYLLAAECSGIVPILVANKMDLLAEPSEHAEFQGQFAHYAAIGYRIFWVSARHPASLAPLIQELIDQTSVLVGQSGVGKSSLVKALLPDREIQIGRLSEATGLGRHTTSAATCYRLPQGGWIIDSPGVRRFRLGHIDRQAVEWGFREFRDHAGLCRFNNCRHLEEPGCAIRQAVAAGRISPLRLASFHRLLEDCERQALPGGT